MNQLNTIINDLEQNADEMAVQAAIAYLKSMQPSDDNSKIAEELSRHMNRLYMASDMRNRNVSQQIGEFLDCANRAIAALSRPVPFDVLGHLRNSGVGSDQHGNLFKFENGKFLVKGFNSDHFTSNRHSFLECLMYGDIIKPYTQQEPELEDGWYWVEYEMGHASGPYRRKNGLWYDNYTRLVGSQICIKPITNPATGKPWLIEQPEV